jgi:hypothetical protein
MRYFRVDGPAEELSSLAKDPLYHSERWIPGSADIIAYLKRNYG